MAHVTKGNVFEDLLTQVQAAEFFEVPRPKVSQIQSNKLDGISIEYLVRMLVKTGGKLTCRFRQPSKQVAVARVRARAAA